MMNSELHIYRTNELTPSQITGICTLFREIFHKEKTEEYFRRQSSNTVLGYSYHCLAECNGEVVGAFSCIPYRFYDRKKNRELLMTVCVDAMISKRAKLGPLGVRFMFDMLKESMTQDHIEFVYSFPNDNFYPYNIKILGMKDIGILDFYVLPASVGLFKKTLRFLNPLVRAFSQLAAGIGILLTTDRPEEKRFEKIDTPAFRHHRYDERHSILAIGDHADAVATLYQEDFGPVAYILDITPLSGKNFFRAMIRTIQLLGKKSFVIAFPVQRLPFGNLLRVPRKWLPRKLHMVGFCLDEKNTDPDFFDLNQWNSNLSVFDVR